MSNRQQRRAGASIERRQPTSQGRPMVGHVAVVTPAYASCAPQFAQSLVATFVELNAAGYAISPIEAHGGSHIDLVRDILAAGVLASGADRSLWIDVDQSWVPRDAVRLVMALADPSVDYAGLRVSAKVVNWKAVGEAARAGTPDDKLLDAGCAGWTTLLRPEDVSAQDGYVGPRRRIDTPLGEVILVRAKRVPTAFACIRRSVFDRAIHASPERIFTRNGQGLHHMFASGLGANGWRGEDEAFTEVCDRIGVTSWVWPEPVVGHHGPFEFRSGVGLQEWAKREAGR
jgi:hypothetical protein